MKKQILSEEFQRMQKLAGLINESQSNKGEVSFGPFTNVEWYKVGGKSLIRLIVSNSDNFREIEDAMNFKNRDFMTDKEISNLNNKLNELADKMSDYLTSIGVKNGLFDNPIGDDQEIDSLVIDINISDFDKLK